MSDVLEYRRRLRWRLHDAADGSYSAISSLNSAVVAAGAHTAYITFFTTDGTTMYTYTNQYNIYKP